MCQTTGWSEVRWLLIAATYFCGFVGTIGLLAAMMFSVPLIPALWTRECSTSCSGQITFMRANVFCLLRAVACTASRILNTFACLLADLMPCDRPAASVADLVHEISYEGASAMFFLCLLALSWTIQVFLLKCLKQAGQYTVQATSDTLIVKSAPDSVRRDRRIALGTDK